MQTYYFPLLSGDGGITSLSELKVHHTPEIDFTYAEATADISWHLETLGPEVINLLEQNNNNPNANSFNVQIHVRSFLARSGLDAEILELHLKDGLLTAKIQLIFLVDRLTEQNGLEFPLERAFRKTLNKTNPIKIANLVFLPNEARHLNQEQIEIAKDKNELILPPRYSFDKNADQLELPLGSNEYPTAGVRAFTDADLQSFLSDGKRKLQLAQPSMLASAFLKPGFDVRDIDPIYADQKYCMLLARWHRLLKHSNSRYLKLSPQAPRHVELQAETKNMHANSVRIGARIYREDSQQKTLVSLTPTKPAYTSLDQALKDQSTLDFLSLIEQTPRLNGVVITKRGIFFVPNDRNTIADSWAIAAAKDRVVDQRVINSLDNTKLVQMKNHLLAKNIQQMLANSTDHYKTAVYFCKTLPEPDIMQRLAKDSGAGIASFVALEARTITNRDQHLYSSFTLSAEALSQYRRYVESGEIDIFWLTPPSTSQRQIMKLVGQSFVRLGLEQFYRSLDIGLAVYCSDQEIAKKYSPFASQMAQVINSLQQLEQRSAIITGGSGLLASKISDLLPNDPNLAVASFSTLFGADNNQSPDFRPAIITLCPPEDPRAPIALLAEMADIRLVFNGRLGTTNALVSDLLSIQRGQLTAGPVGVIGLYGEEDWAKVIKGLRALADPWVANLFSNGQNVDQFITEVRAYIDNPLNWLNERSVPENIQREGLASHLNRTSKMGRKPASFLIPALLHFGLLTLESMSTNKLS